MDKGKINIGLLVKSIVITPIVLGLAGAIGIVSSILVPIFIMALIVFISYITLDKIDSS